MGIAVAWLAGVLLFIAFHPGGVQLKDGKSAGNPVDVFKFILSQRGQIGNFGKAAKASDTTTQAQSPSLSDAQTQYEISAGLGLGQASSQGDTTQPASPVLI